MSETICGIDCGGCSFKENCGGCSATNGHPFGSECLIAECCKTKGHEHCSNCLSSPCGLKKQLIDEFNALGIADMKKFTDLYALKVPLSTLNTLSQADRRLSFGKMTKSIWAIKFARKTATVVMA